MDDFQKIQINIPFELRDNVRHKAKQIFKRINEEEFSFKDDEAEELLFVLLEKCGVSIGEIE